MANRCVSLDATWAHLPAPPPSHHTWLSPVGAAGFGDDALTAALWASMAPSAGAGANAGAASSYSSAVSPTPSSSTTTTSSASAEILAGAASARPTACGGTRAATRPSGRVSKRKPRPSRRAHTTYISADPADFRRMVQEVTGFPVPGAHTAYAYASASSTPAPAHAAAALACVLPTLDTSAFLLDRASPPPPPPQPEPKSKTTSSTSPTTMASTPAVADEASSSLLLQELEAMISASAFPTLESWGMI